MKRQQKKFREILGILSQTVLSQEDIRKIKHSVNDQSCLDGYSKETIRRITNNSSYSISREQTDFAINYLKEKLFRKDGQLRKNTGPFGDREIEIINNFKEFRFIGFRAHPYRDEKILVMGDEKIRIFSNDIAKGFGPKLEILYETIDKKGNSFIYTGVYFESIEIIN